MSAETKPGKIAPALIAIMREISAIDKGGYNQQQKFKFRGIEQVLNCLNGVFKTHGVVILTDVLAHKVSEFKTKHGTSGYHHLTDVRFRFMAEDGSEVAMTSIGEAMDYGDKGASKTLSIALKYALVNMFLIPTEEMAKDDPDATTHEVAKSPASKPTTPHPATIQKTPAEKAEAWAAKRAELKWFEIVNPLATPAKWKSKPLSDLAADGDIKSLQAIKTFFAKSESANTPALTGLLKKLDMAIAEAKSNEVPTATDPATGKEVDAPY